MAGNIHSGGCLCGAVRFEATGPAEKPHTCSCRFCQRHTGAPTAAWVEFPAGRIAWTGAAGRPSTWRSSDYSSRAFCPACGSSMGAIDDEPVVALLVGSFDDPTDPAFMPEYHSFEDCRPGWIKVETASVEE
ncbi:GFA family protein [Shinella zoogloeoides]|uniref:GFA family protein n=1 Tax=Shinella zoogloeoides TaxID=352475 RepID=UPI001F5759C2|nr:GFA family protein [Shinella zoogloeoides]